MFELEKSFSFSAAHQLVNHCGACARKHGHTYELILTLRLNELQTTGPKTNMTIDFADLENLMKDLLDNYLDHHWLNDTLQSDSPTLEFIANWIFQKVKEPIPQLHSVTVAVPFNRITYSE